MKKNKKNRTIEPASVLSSINSAVDVLLLLVLEPAGNREYVRGRGRRERVKPKGDKMVKENRREQL